MPRIYTQKNGTSSEADRLELLRLLGKLGYTVRHGREKPPGKPTGAWIYFVEYWEDGKVGQDQN